MAFTTTMSSNIGLQQAIKTSLGVQGSMQCNVPYRTKSDNAKTASCSKDCAKKMFVFAGCNCKYISPHLCTTNHSCALFAKQTKFRAECARCQAMGLQLKFELTKSKYEDAINSEEDFDDAAIDLCDQYSKACRDMERLMRGIKRDAQNVEGWECID